MICHITLCESHMAKKFYLAIADAPNVRIHGGSGSTLKIEAERKAIDRLGAELSEIATIRIVE